MFGNNETLHLVNNCLACNKIHKMKTYTIDYFIDKFESIAEDKWSQKASLEIIYDNYKFLGITLPFTKRTIKKSALIMLLDKKTLSNLDFFNTSNFVASLLNHPEISAFISITQDGKPFDHLIIEEISCGLNSHYKESTAKKRVLSYLWDLKVNYQTSIYSEHQYATRNFS